MHKRAQKRLAFGLRLLLLGSCLCAGGFAAVWHWWPEQVDRLERWLRRQAHGSYYHDASLAEQSGRDGDRAGQLAQLQRLADRTSAVRRLDQLADLRSKVLVELGRVAEAAGDRDTAVRAARAHVALDPRNLIALARLGHLLAATPVGRDEAIGLMAPWQQKVPRNPYIGAELVTAQIEAGRLAEASTTLAAALAWQQPDWWQVAWQCGQPEDSERHAGLQPLRLPDGSWWFDCTIVDALQGVSLIGPAFASCELRGLTCTVEPEGGGPARTLPASVATATNLRRDGELVVLYGESDPRLDFRVDPPLPPGRHHLRFRATYRATPPDWVCVPLAGKAGRILVRQTDGEIGRQLAAARTRLMAGLPLEVFWAADADHITAEQSRTRPLQPDQRSPGRLLAELTVRPPFRVLRIDLPPQVDADWQLPAIELLAAGGQPLASLPATTALVWHDVELRDGWLVPTGDDPYLVYEVPETAAEAVTVRVQAEAR